jgi:hypothetical protein
MIDLNQIINNAIAAEVQYQVAAAFAARDSLLSAVDSGKPVTVESFPELFAIEFNRKFDPNNVLNRADVVEVVKELWDDEYEGLVTEMVDSAVGDIDVDDNVRQALRNASVSIDI